MSFIHEDKQLLWELLKAAQATPAPSQPAQPAPAKPTKPEDNIGSYLPKAKELIKNLYNQLEGGFSFTAERPNADLSQAHVVSVEELLNFLQFNGIKANGRDLVLNARQFKDSATGKMTDLVKSMGEAGKDYVSWPFQATPQYYIYRDGMIGFLKDLEKQAENNPMLRAIVSKLKEQLATVIPEKTTPKTDVAGNSSTPTANPQQSGRSAATVEAINNVISRLPFNRRDIDFDRFNAFFDAVTPLLQHVPQASAYIADAKRLMNQFNTQILDPTRGQVPITLGMSGTAFTNLFQGVEDTSKGTQGTQASKLLPAIKLLHRIVDDTRAVLDIFFSQYGTGNFLNDAARSAIRKQIGFNQTDQSDYSINTDWLNNLQSSTTFT